MPVKFDSPAPSTGRIVFDDEPSSRIVFDEPSPYAAIIKEAQDFQKRAAENTPERAFFNLEREAADEAYKQSVYPIGVWGTQVDVPKVIPEVIGPLAARVAPPIATAIGLGSGVGTLPTIGALLLAGGAGEFAGQTLEKGIGQRDQYSLAEGALNTALTPVTVGPLKGVSAPLVRMGIRGLEGAGLAAGQDIGMRAIRGEEQNLGETLRNAGIGGVIGGTLGLGEFGRGRSLGVASQGGVPSELSVVGQAMREPIIPQVVEPALPQATDVVPAELSVVRQAQAISRAEQTASRTQGERAVASLDEAVDSEKVRKLAERMMGKTPDQQLAVLDQEMRLQKDYLTPAEQRAGLDMKQELQRQIDSQKAMEEAASLQASLNQARSRLEQQFRQAKIEEQLSDIPARQLAGDENVVLNSSPAASQLTKLDVNLGAGVGAQAERARLNAIVRAERPVVNDPVTPPLSPQAQRMMDEYGRVSPSLLAPIGGAAAGGAAGFAAGDTPEERLALAMAGAAAGATGTAIALRMAKAPTPQGKLSVLDQEMKLRKGTLTEAEERLGLDTRNQLKAEIDAQKAMDEAASAQQKAVADQQKAMADAQKADAIPQPEPAPPPFQQKPRSMANEAAELAGTSKKNDNVTLQASLNQISGVKPVPPQPISAPALATDAVNPVAAAIPEPVAAGRPPVTTDPAKIAADRVEYDALQAQMKKLGYDKMGTDEFNAIWQKSEDIKNRHGGMPPVAKVVEPVTVQPDAISEADFLKQATPESAPVAGRDAEATRAASIRRQQRGAVPVSALAPIGGAGAGGVTGFATTEREPGESDEAFQARRLARTGLGAMAGLVAGSGGAVASKIRFNRLPASQSNEINAVRKMMMAADKQPKGMVESFRDASFDFMTRANTAWAPLEKLQRDVYKLVNRPFKAGSYYDLSDRGEAIAGAVVHAQRDAGRLADLVNAMPKNLSVRFPEYLIMSRIKDRLERIPLETQRLQDAVGIAQAELDAAKTAFGSSKTLSNAGAINTRKAELAKAITKLNEEADRLRVKGWGMDANAKNNPANGLADMEAELGPQNFAIIQKAGQDFQGIMLDNLRRQVDSGRIPMDDFKAISGATNFYAPFKVMKHYDEAHSQAYGGGGKGVVGTEKIAKPITGIDDDDLRLANPLDPAFEQIYKGTLLAEKNRFLREVSTLTALDKNGEYIRILGPEDKARKGFKEVPFFRNGEPVRMEVGDDVYNALTSPMSWAEKNVVLNSLRAGSTLFKMGATALQAPFQIANATIFDPARLGLISKYGIKNPVDFARFVAVDYPVGMWSSVRTSLNAPNELGEKWLASGAANSTFSRVMSPEAFAKSLPSEKGLGKLVWEKQFGLVPLKNASAVVSSILENSAKMTGLKRALRFEDLDNLTPVQRERKWREIVHEIRNYAGSPDFNRMGTDMGIVNVLAPFTNARWQGFIADAGRVLGNTKEGQAARIRLATMVGAPAAGLALWNLRPDNKADYEQIPERERQRGFYVPLYKAKDGSKSVLPTNVDGTKNPPLYFKDGKGRELREYYVIPKREIPQMMANTTESFVKWLGDEDPEAFNGLIDTFLNVAAPVSLEGRNATEMGQSAMAGVNPIIRTPMEMMLNRDMFRQRDIIPESRVGALQENPEKTYTPTTPEVYKTIAGVVPEEFPSILRSPAMVQKMIEDFTGGFPRQFINPKDKPDMNFGERITRRFRRSENVEMGDTESALDVAAGKATAIRVDDRDVADAIVAFAKDVQDMARVQTVIQQGIAEGKITEGAYNEIVRQLKESMMGYTSEQERISRIGKKERAFYFDDYLKRLRPEEVGPYIQDVRQKGLMDPGIEAMMLQIK